MIHFSIVSDNVDKIGGLLVDVPLEQWTPTSLLQDTENGPLLALTLVNGPLRDHGQVNVMLPNYTSLDDPMLDPRYKYVYLGF